jgi:4-phytase/acid phosphatase
MPRSFRPALIPFPFLRLLALLFAAVLAALPLARADDPEGQLKLVIVLTRHGVRSPLQTNEVLGKFAAEPWPEWTVKPGILTPHGRAQMVQMGSYYRARYVAAGLLTGDAAKDAPTVFFRANNEQRTMETARALADGLLPGAGEPNLHTRPAGQIDALFVPVKAGASNPDRPLAIAALLGRIGNDPANLVVAYRAEFDALQRVLGPVAGKPGKTSVLDVPAVVKAGEYDHTVALEGPVRAGMRITDALLLEYTEGLPMQDVGWGRLDSATLTQLLRLHALYFDLTQSTLYPAQAQASNLADHILQTLQRSASGAMSVEAFGKPEHKLVVISGHDTNIINFGGLLGANWFLPGTQLNPVLPGGALVLELRERTEGRCYVRVLYVSQTLDQIRNLTPLSLEQPPAIAPIFIPGCSEATPGYDIPFAKFEALLQRVIDPQFVLTGSP